MKKLLPFLALLFAVSVSSCKKDSGTTTPSGTGAKATLTATRYGFDGSTAATSFNATAAGIVKTSLGGMTQLAISGIRDGGKESISIIVLQDVRGTGKISFGPDLENGGIVIRKDYTNVADLTMSYSTDNSGTSMKGGGEINITAYDGTNIEGTFYAIGYNSTGKEAYAEQGSFKGKIN